MKLFLSISVAFLMSVFVHPKSYQAHVDSVHDGDTFECMVDLGLETYGQRTIRLMGIDAPELNTKDGKASRDALKGLIETKQVTIITNNDQKEKYGRLLAVVFIGETNVNDWMIAKGYAKEYDGGER